VISNVGLAKSLGNIEAVSQEISNTRSSIDVFVKESRSIADAGRENADQLRAVSSQVSSEITKLEGTVSALRTENGQLRDTLTPIPARIDELSAKLAEAIPIATVNSPPPKIEKSSEPVEVQLENYLKRTSLVGLGSSLAMALSFQTEKQLSCEDVGKALSIEADYIHGFIVALHSAGIVSTTPVKDKTRTLLVNRVEAFLEKLKVEDVRTEVRRRGIGSEKIWLHRVDALALLYK
jgi:hypothetical protein